VHCSLALVRSLQLCLVRHSLCYKLRTLCSMLLQCASAASASHPNCACSICGAAAHQHARRQGAFSSYNSFQSSSSTLHALQRMPHASMLSTSVHGSSCIPRWQQLHLQMQLKLGWTMLCRASHAMMASTAAAVAAAALQLGHFCSICPPVFNNIYPPVAVG
jgi:hypothetical protein